nr:SpoIVB peptidase [Lentibacillus saliphilus]
MRLTIGILLLMALFTAPFLTPFQNYLTIPNEIVTFNNQSPIEVPKIKGNITVEATSSDMMTPSSIDTEFYAEKPGKSQLVYKLAGLPIKKVNVSILDDLKVVPGGQSIGVRLQTLGVLVVGHHIVNGNNGAASPGEDANIKVGDIILKINGQDIQQVEDVKPLVTKAGEKKSSLELTVKRGKETFETTLKPIQSKQDQAYQIGLYIRDSAAGIGTMTFYDPRSKKYGALGHVISDMDTKKPIEIHNGSIVKSTITSIEKGQNGSPGEKQASFSIKDDALGTITKNSPFGVFGVLDQGIKNGIKDKPLPIALSHEVKEGPAKILTVVDGEEVESFDVEVINSVPQKYPATKGMIIQVTDKKLLDKTGGIVQGMSGSPIIQDGKVIGAVTHVFVNDSTSGYGVHIEWMMQEAGINIYKEEEKAG